MSAWLLAIPIGYAAFVAFLLAAGAYHLRNVL